MEIKPTEEELYNFRKALEELEKEGVVEEDFCHKCRRYHKTDYCKGGYK